MSNDSYQKILIIQNTKKTDPSVLSRAHENSEAEIILQMLELFHSRVDKRLFIKKISIGFGRLIGKDKIPEKMIQYGLFDDVEALEKKRRQKELQVQKEESIQKAVLDIKEKYGKNALLRGISYQKEATARERNGQIGGHRA